MCLSRSGKDSAYAQSLCALYVVCQLVLPAGTHLQHFPFCSWEQIAAIIVFMVALLLVYVNSNMIYINPMLNLIGYHLYEVTLEHSELSHYLIIRDRIVRGERLHLVKIGESIFLGRRA